MNLSWSTAFLPYELHPFSRRQPEWGHEHGWKRRTFTLKKKRYYEFQRESPTNFPSAEIIERVNNLNAILQFIFHKAFAY